MYYQSEFSEHTGFISASLCLWLQLRTSKSWRWEWQCNLLWQYNTVQFGIMENQDLVTKCFSGLNSGFTTKAFLSKATFKSLNFLGSCGAWAFGIERFLKVLRLSALTGLIRNLLLRLSEISLAEIGLRQIWMRWLGGRSSSMSEIQKREKARRWIFKRQIKKMAKLICQLKFFNGTRIISITPYK